MFRRDVREMGDGKYGKGPSRTKGRDNLNRENQISTVGSFIGLGGFGDLKANLICPI
jgi:hypothetical protein